MARRLAAFVSVLCSAFADLAVGSPLPVQVFQPDLNYFRHIRWTTETGGLANASDITQTPDGYLWIASDAVYRFDGVAFERFAAPPGSAMERSSPAMFFVSKAGELFVGYSQNGGLAVYRDGRLQDLRMPDPPREIVSIAETPDGAIWVSSSVGYQPIKRFANNRWKSIEDAGLPPGTVSVLIASPQGGLLAGIESGDKSSTAIFYKPPGTERFVSTPYRFGQILGFSRDRQGNLWATDDVGTRLFLDRSGRPPATPIFVPAVPGQFSVLLAFDHSGALWAATMSVGIFYVANPSIPLKKPTNVIQTFREANGLTSDVAFAPFVDREGNIWVSTKQGFDQFQPIATAREPVVPAEPFNGVSMAQVENGSIYAASKGNVYRIAPGEPTRTVHKFDSSNFTLCQSREGGVWLVTPDRVVRLAGKQPFRSVGPGVAAKLLTCAEDSLGRLWLVVAGTGLAWRDANGWHHTAGQLGDLRPFRMTATPNGDIAFLTLDAFYLLQGDRLTKATTARLGLGTPTMIVAAGNDLYLGGRDALIRMRGNRIARIDVRRTPWITSIRSIVQTAQGATWLTTPDGISKVSTAELDRAFTDPAAPLRRRLLTIFDGVRSPQTQVGNAGRQSLADRSGRVWYLHQLGLSSIDPARLSTNGGSPPVAIRWLAADGKSYIDPTKLVLPAGTRDVEIAYAGLSFITPQRVQFRYRLDGIDKGWVDPGTRRSASYANLGPGKYSFQVIAANAEGVWNYKGAMIEFEILPTFFEGWPFRFLCLLAILASLWFAYRARLRAVAERIRSRMAERLEERERIARELHDTLLQSVQSLTLRFQLAVDDMPPGAPARPALEQAIDRADAVIAEGRDRVRDLRPAHDAQDLRTAISHIVDRQGFGPDVDVSVAQSGVVRSLDPLVYDAVLQIASEAIFNVWRHSGASRLKIEFSYQSSLTILFSDNGRGIERDVLSRGKDGHFGLTGMRERAKKLRASLRIVSPSEGGTEVALTIRGRIAYAKRRGRLGVWTRLMSRSE